MTTRSRPPQAIPPRTLTVAESPAESGEDRPETPENVEGQPEAEPTADDQPKPGVVVETSESQFGEILFDGERRRDLHLRQGDGADQ